MIFIIILSLFLLLITYVFYPLIVIFLSKYRNHTEEYNSINFNIFHLVIPLHNEERVIQQKLESILQLNYPKDKIYIHIGLDACTDETKNIIVKYNNILNINIYDLSNRIGKPNVINHILEHIENKESIILFSDADIIFDKDVLHKINHAFQKNDVGIVDVYLKNIYSKNIEENTYSSIESNVKHAESLLFNLFQGASGACYAIKKKYFKPIPPNFLVDDYFISIHVFLQYAKGIFLKDCIVYEQKNTSLIEEFNRKIRIAAGSFQNAWYFKNLILKITQPIGFTFIFHKLIRWLLPIFMLIALCYLLIIYPLISFVLTLIFSLLGFLFSIFDVKYNPIKIIAYFIFMQIAVFIGLLKYLKGINTNIWQPTSK